MAKLVLCALAMSTLLTACTSYRGPEQIHLPSSAGAPARTLGLRQIFSEDLANALAARRSMADQNVLDARRDRLMNSGFALIRSNCVEFFNEMGRNQRNSRVLRDLLTPVTTVLNGLIGLNAFSSKEGFNDNFATGFALASGASASVLDIYDNRFLFGAENIGSVSTMTMSALSAHQDSVEQSRPTDIVFAVTQLQSNEDICTPTQILTLVRESIKNAKPSGPLLTEQAQNGSVQVVPAPPPPPVVNSLLQQVKKNDHRPISVK